MRLINITTFQLKDVYDNRALPDYAILAHCWGDPADEVSYQAFVSESFDRSSDGWKKIEACCSIAKRRDIAWAWVNTSCINKESSAELTEAINSMFTWYQLSKECYVFLPDVDLQPHDFVTSVTDWNHGATPRNRNIMARPTAFTTSRWFTGGWTLQELLAPQHVEFYSKDYVFLGARYILSSSVSLASGIQEAYLDGRKSIQQASIAERMSWACGRNTQRIEDEAYCLLGIYDVNMPLLYGEGHKAFLRLQMAIIQQSDDESIFAWNTQEAATAASLFHGLLAPSAKSFRGSGGIVGSSRGASASPFEVTKKGLRYHFPMWQGPNPYLAVTRSIRLACEDIQTNEYIILHTDLGGQHWYRSRLERVGLSRWTRLTRRLSTLSGLLLPETHVYMAITGSVEALSFYSAFPLCKLNIRHILISFA